jgi:hypothetical protein
MTPRMVLAIGLALTSVVLALAVLIGIMSNHRELSEVGSQVLMVCIAAMAGALGFELGNLVGKKDSE